MIYEIETTNVFDKWFSQIRDTRHRARILARIKRIQIGNFGDHKIIDTNIFELRFFFGPGFRIYYTIKDDRIIFLLTGGDKSSQKNDIEKARAIMEDLI
jgi:putative addiction module killer protein